LVFKLILLKFGNYHKNSVQNGILSNLSMILCNINVVNPFHFWAQLLIFQSSAEQE